MILPPAGGAHRGGAATEVEGHPVGLEGGGDDGAGGRLLLGEQAVAGLDELDGGAEAGERLGELAADRPAAEHDEGVGERLEVEDRLVRQVAGLGEPGDRWEKGRRAGGEDEAAGANGPLAGGEGPGRHEAGRGGEELDALALERGSVLAGGDRRDGRPHRPERLGEGTAVVGRLDERLRGDATGERALAAGPVALDEERPGAASHPGAGRREAGGTTADDDEVVGQGRRSLNARRAPLWRRVRVLLRRHDHVVTATSSRPCASKRSAGGRSPASS